MHLFRDAQIPTFSNLLCTGCWNVHSNIWHLHSNQKILSKRLLQFYAAKSEMEMCFEAICVLSINITHWHCSEQHNYSLMALIYTWLEGRQGYKVSRFSFYASNVHMCPVCELSALYGEPHIVANSAEVFYPKPFLWLFMRTNHSRWLC